MTSALNLFDGIVYINLDKRQDRKRSIEKELKRVSVERAFRIPGHDDELNGSRGCVLSHIKALDFALDQGWKNVLVLEDDCFFVKNQEEINSYINPFLAHFKNDWDVFFLGAKIKEFQKSDHEAFVKVDFSLRAHAYVVNGPYLSQLREHFLCTYASMENDLFFVSSLHKALDRQWVELQKKDRWFSGKAPIAHQRRSFSDIEKGFKPQR